MNNALSKYLQLKKAGKNPANDKLVAAYMEGPPVCGPHAKLNGTEAMELNKIIAKLKASPKAQEVLRLLTLSRIARNKNHPQSAVFKPVA